MTTPEGLHLNRAAQMEPLRGSCHGEARRPHVAGVVPPPATWGYAKCNPSGVVPEHQPMDSTPIGRTTPYWMSGILPLRHILGNGVLELARKVLGQLSMLLTVNI